MQINHITFEQAVEKYSIDVRLNHIVKNDGVKRRMSSASTALQNIIDIVEGDASLVLSTHINYLVKDLSKGKLSLFLNSAYSDSIITIPEIKDIDKFVHNELLNILNDFAYQTDLEKLFKISRFDSFFKTKKYVNYLSTKETQNKAKRMFDNKDTSGISVIDETKKGFKIAETLNQPFFVAKVGSHPYASDEEFTCVFKAINAESKSFQYHRETKIYYPRYVVRFPDGDYADIAPGCPNGKSFDFDGVIDSHGGRYFFYNEKDAKAYIQHHIDRLEDKVAILRALI